MNTFVELWPYVKSEFDARQHIESEIKSLNLQKPTNLEEQAISLVGVTIYQKLVKEYIEKQWGRMCTDLPPSIIKRLPVRFAFNNNYFDDKYQGIPKGGYTKMVKNILSGIDLLLNTDFLQNRERFFNLGEKIIFTGSIDEFYNYRFGTLEYRSLRFVTKHFENTIYQNNAVINHTSHEVPIQEL